MVLALLSIIDNYSLNVSKLLYKIYFSNCVLLSSVVFNISCQCAMYSTLFLFITRRVLYHTSDYLLCLSQILSKVVFGYYFLPPAFNFGGKCLTKTETNCAGTNKLFSQSF